mmetsp:Transcript_73799/g.159733  ORF Transcript_73799/g.159733 Transcript_73799/m.159733 type:complete len:257 (+) Transcript_73799:162-932(+)
MILACSPRIAGDTFADARSQVRDEKAGALAAAWYGHCGEESVRARWTGVEAMAAALLTTGAGLVEPSDFFRKERVLYQCHIMDLALEEGRVRVSVPLPLECDAAVGGEARTSCPEDEACLPGLGQSREGTLPQVLVAIEDAVPVQGDLVHAHIGITERHLLEGQYHVRQLAGIHVLLKAASIQILGEGIILTGNDPFTWLPKTVSDCGVLAPVKRLQPDYAAATCVLPEVKLLDREDGAPSPLVAVVVRVVDSFYR